MSATYRVAEQFVSINGEGTRAGELAVFVRLCGCNLQCSYCDTQWANQPDVSGLIAAITAQPTLSLEIETNGSVPLQSFAAIQPRPIFTMDYKLPSSGMEHKMCLENMQLLQPQDTVKLVSGSLEDLERGAALIQQYDLTHRCHVYFSPVFGSIEPQEMVQFLIERKLNGVRLQLQLHKYIWDPQERGV